MISAGTTERLVLKPLELADADAIQQLFPHWEVVQYLANRVPWPYPPDGAHSYCKEIALPQIEHGEAWHWTLRLATAPRHLIGAISLMRARTTIADFGWASRGAAKAS